MNAQHITEGHQKDQIKLDIEGISGRVTNSCGMTFVYISPGTFSMGSEENENGRDRDEVLHQVYLSEGFLLSHTEITVGQWRRFIRATDYRTEAEKEKAEHYWAAPGLDQSDDHPVTCISFNDIDRFIQWLNKTEGHTYRLPTEAQWEYACRAGSRQSRFWGDLAKKACLFSNNADLSLQKEVSEAENNLCEDGFAYTAPAASFRPNGFGLYDMLGNVAEWCRDKYGRYLPVSTSFHLLLKKVAILEK